MMPRQKFPHSIALLWSAANLFVVTSAFAGFVVTFIFAGSLLRQSGCYCEILRWPYVSTNCILQRPPTPAMASSYIHLGVTDVKRYGLDRHQWINVLCAQQ